MPQIHTALNAAEPETSHESQYKPEE
jgi:hypothetical protein